MKCQSPTPCSQNALVTVHDRRGCKDLCITHAAKRLTQSFAMPIGAKCACGRIVR